MNTYVKCLQRLIAAGYPRDKAMLAVSSAFGLTPEQVVRLAQAAA